MTKADIEKLKFPIGKFATPEIIYSTKIKDWRNEIEQFPESLKNITNGLTQEQLNWKYRPGGWKIKQLVHHCLDSHINSYTRFNLTLTEDSPTIRPYSEKLWAELPGSNDEDLSDSILILTGLHSKWTKLIKSLTEADLAKEYVHPEHGQWFNLQETVGLYAWHCKHHLAHIKQALVAEGKFN